MLAIAAGLRQHETGTLEKERAQATKRLKRGELAEKNKRDSLIDALEKFTSEDFNAEKLSLARLAVIIRWRGGEAKNLKRDDREEALAEWARVAPHEDECQLVVNDELHGLKFAAQLAAEAEEVGGADTDEEIA